ncbi:GntR family transcriptional regulator, partial [Agromyces albus]
MPRADHPASALAWETLLDLGDSPLPLRDRLEAAIRDAVSDGRIPAGAALPPSRTLAETLGVSRWVVTEAYGQLVAEGFLESRVGSATRVPVGPAAHVSAGAAGSRHPFAEPTEPSAPTAPSAALRSPEAPRPL